jgi:RsiW-degrading membrane proteinase PrsW (M82 family)
VAFAFVAVSAIVPSLLLMWFFHARDVFREPPRVLWATFGLGVLTIPCVLLTVLPVMLFTGLDEIANPYLQGLASAFLSAAVPEELFKFLVVYLYASRHKDFDEPMDGIVYGAAASLGFATLENVMYVSSGGMSVAVMRALTAVPGHAFSGALLGYFIGQAKFRPSERGKLLSAALFFPIMLHGIYDWGLLTLKTFGERNIEMDSFDERMTVALVLLSLAALVVEVAWALAISARLRKEQLRIVAELNAARGITSKPLRRWVGWLMVIPGAVIAWAGGILSLGFCLGLLLGTNDPSDVGPLMLVLVFVGLIWVAGFMLFGYGIRRLNATGT